MPTKAKGRGRSPVPVGDDGLPHHYVTGFYAQGVSRNIAELYPRRVFDKLRKDHKISEPRQIKALRTFLAYAASTYFADALAEQQHTPAYEANERFSRIRKNTAAVLEDIRKLESQFRLAVARESEHALQETLSAPIREDAYFSGRKTARASRLVPIRAVGAEHLTLALEQVAFVAQRQLETFSARAGGRPANHALRTWIASAQAFWEETLGRKFRFKASKDGHTPAFEFCKAALEPLAPEVSDSTLGNAMKPAITRKRRAIGKNAPKKRE